MSRFIIADLPLSDLKLVKRQRIGDSRGFLSRLFCTDEMRQCGWDKPIVQINHTYTARCGVVRGLHFQRPPFAEMKLLSCLRGAVWDVAIDIRAGSPTFLQWHAERLAGDDDLAMLIPEGFAHGFQTMTDDVEMLYFHSAPYVPKAEDGLHPRDSRLAIPWPLAIAELSPRDRAHSMLTDSFSGIPI